MYNPTDRRFASDRSLKWLIFLFPGYYDWPIILTKQNLWVRILVGAKEKSLKNSEVPERVCRGKFRYDTDFPFQSVNTLEVCSIPRIPTLISFEFACLYTLLLVHCIFKGLVGPSSFRSVDSCSSINKWLKSPLVILCCSQNYCSFVVGVGNCLVFVRITRHIKGSACCVVFVFMQQKFVVKLPICFPTSFCVGSL